MSRLNVAVAERPRQPARARSEDEAENESDVEFELDADPEKDEKEEELERLVFGDSAGFRAGLKSLARIELEQEDDAKIHTGLEGLEDADLFMTDVEPSDARQGASAEESDDDTLRSRHKPAWEDSDDERMMISLASVPRLRKLRRTEAEDYVNGKEYSKRLRQQFEMLNPVPEWARQALTQPARKKRRLSGPANGDMDVSEEDADMDVDDDLPSSAPLAKLLHDAESLIRPSDFGAGKKRKLRPEVIDIQRTKDIADVQPSAITSLSFHPRLPLLLSSGPSSTLYLHHIASSPPAPAPNPLLTSMHVRGAPLSTTAFHPSDDRIFLSARRRYFHVWNLTTGRVEKISRVYGQQHDQRSMERFKLSPDGSYMALLGSARKGGGVINILSASSLQWVCQVRIESRGGVADFSWWSDSKGICVVGKSGEVTECSITAKRIVARWQDEGAVGTTTLALGGKHDFRKSTIGSDRWVAIGSSSGIVNIYDRRSWLAAPVASADQPIPPQPTPTKTFDQITTPTSHLAFSPDGQLLAMASRWKADALRLIHLPSCTVFRNWPTNSTPLGRITSVAFAEGAVAGKDVHSLLAVANEQGKIRMWEIR